MRLRVWLLVAATLASIILSQTAFAARVVQVKGKQVLLDLEGQSAGIGDKYFIIMNGKKKGLVTIKKIGKQKAIATLDKGKAEVNATAQFAKAAGDSSSAQASASPSRKSSGGSSQKYWGVLVGYSMDSQTAKIINPGRTLTDEAAMSGTGFSAVGFADIPYSGDLGFIGRAGIETFNVTGSIPATDPWCAGNTNECKSNIMYFTGDALIRYKFGAGQLVPWVAAGLGIYFPISKSTTALGDIGLSSVFLIDGGLNYNLSKTTYIPVMLEYGYFPPSPDVSTHVISLRAGYAMTF